MNRSIFLHLVSDSSGELVEMLARNAVPQLEGVRIERRLWQFVRDIARLSTVIAAIGETPGFVLHSLAATDLRNALEDTCRRLEVPYAFALEPLVRQLSETYDVPIRFRTSAREVLDDDYFRRIEAMKYTLAHDDGQASQDLAEADVILVGVSRATKTPTCMCLASRGVKAANVPLVPGIPLPADLDRATRPLIVGLTLAPARLATIRAARLRTLKQDSASDYADLAALRREVGEARRTMARAGWQLIDVTERSIEETTQMIIDLLEQHRASQP
jgi:regulator of PEP synthase PpsR (kinase-PPPase family)